MKCIKICFLVTGGSSIDIPMRYLFKYYLAFNSFQEHIAYNFVTHLKIIEMEYKITPTGRRTFTYQGRIL